MLFAKIDFHRFLCMEWESDKRYGTEVMTNCTANVECPHADGLIFLSHDYSFEAVRTQSFIDNPIPESLIVLTVITGSL